MSNGHALGGSDDGEITQEFRLFFAPDGSPRPLPQNEPIRQRVCVYGYVRRTDGCILFVRPNWQRHRLELPGGGVKSPESGEECLEREGFDETGFRLRRTSRRPLYVDENFVFLPRKRGYFHVFYSVFPCAIEDGQSAYSSPPFADIEEIHEVCWVRLADLTPHDVHPMHHPLFELFDPFEGLDSDSG